MGYVINIIISEMPARLLAYESRGGRTWLGPLLVKTTGVITIIMQDRSCFSLNCYDWIQSPISLHKYVSMDMLLHNTTSGMLHHHGVSLSKCLIKSNPRVGDHTCFYPAESATMATQGRVPHSHCELRSIQRGSSW